jgi:cytochrome c-type biogenesis protein CcmH
MTLWIGIAIMCLLATVIVAWPLYRQQQQFSALIAGSIGGIVLLALGLYAVQGSPHVPSGARNQPDIEEMVASLAARLEANPDDVNGWKMLGRSYVTLSNFAGAVHAYERAVSIEQSKDAQTLVDLGAALLARDNSRIEGRTSALFESALALEPNNPSALFYGGIAALNRGNTDLAADRWEILLALNPPAEIRGIIEQRVAEWRGGEQPPVASAMPQEQTGVVVVAEIEISAAALASLPAEASVFVIARDPAQPSPPIAVARRTLSEMPATVELSDSDSMIPGRTLSAFAEVEVIARISVSGQPIAQSGDWFGSAVVKPSEKHSVSLLIDQQVP